MSRSFFLNSAHTTPAKPCAEQREPKRVLQSIPVRIKRYAKYVLGVAIASMCANAAYADSADAADCQQDASDVVPSVCVHAAYIEADAKLREAYQSALNLLSADGKFVRTKTELIASQREWLKFRESDCKVRSDLVDRGQTRESMAESCMTDLTEQRADELQQIWLP